MGIRSCSTVFVILFACSLLLGASAAASDRLVEHPIKGLGDVGYQLGKEPERVSGYFKLNRTHDAHMFYFYFESREQKPDDPVVLWMTGGPGCSSEIAVFAENGPWNVNKALEVVETKYGWDVAHNMIYVDQPINTGFSYSEDPRDRIYDEHGVAADMQDFLQELFKARPHLADRDFYVTGESYAGHYVPAVAKHIWDVNQRGTAEVEIKLKGIAIGNGLTDPAIQYGAYGDFAVMNNLISQGLNDAMKLVYPLCNLGISACNGNWSIACELSLLFCQATQFTPILAATGNINVYDIRKTCDFPLCYDFSAIEDYLNLPETRAKLGVGDREWEACSMSVHSDMLGDWMRNYDTTIPPLLEDGIHVMVYAGVQDLICNWLGNKRWVDVLPWSGLPGWQQAPEVEWVVDGSLAGTVRASGPLSFVKVLDAGHMVPMDQPKNALDMIMHFTRTQPLGNGRAAAAVEPPHTPLRRAAHAIA